MPYAKHALTLIVMALVAAVGTVIGGPLLGIASVAYIDYRGDHSRRFRVRLHGSLGGGALLDLAAVLAGIIAGQSVAGIM